MLQQRALGAAVSLLSRQQRACAQVLGRRPYTSKKEGNKVEAREPPDHRKIGHQQRLFLNSEYSPGSPIFLPNGTKIFTRLVDFLRKQYLRYGFEEVISPTIYKKSLWEKSGHLENYAEDMYSVTGKTKTSKEGCCDHGEHHDAEAEEGEFGLKPMNCPGHCLIFASQVRSYRDLPIRYADFSPLHRNEISGALSGLTRVRRFHQDDGHIFCRPSQVEEEIRSTLDFVKTVYSVLRLGVDYRLALSTRPKDHYMGTEEEWERAESALKRALDSSGMPWVINEGDGAFYGPKIDIIVKDSDGKEHQTATVQLDFQLPKRFELEYQAPAPEHEARGETVTDPELLSQYGAVRPVMIHRAVLGSVERLMALLIENYNGKWPLWLNPQQVLIATVNTSEKVTGFAEEVRGVLTGREDKLFQNIKAGVSVPLEQNIRLPTGLSVDIDNTARPLGHKLRDAKEKNYGRIVVIGDRDVAAGTVADGKDAVSPDELRDRLLAKVNRYY